MTPTFQPLPPRTPAEYARVYGRAAVRLAWQYGALTGASRRLGGVFDGVERYVMFVGYPRSGHSVLGSLLDAHPEAVVANEASALQLVHARFGRDRLFAALLDNSERLAAAGRTPGDLYPYAVPGQHQGRYRRLRVIGDKHGEGAGLRLRERPWLLDRLRACVGVPVHVLHVVRNPFDNVATIARRAAQVTGRPVDLDDALRRYTDLHETAASVRGRFGPETWLDVRHEDLIAAPEAALQRVCAGLGLDPADDYLAACAETVYAAPHQSRHRVTWTPAQRAAVERLIAASDPLGGYAFDA